MVWYIDWNCVCALPHFDKRKNSFQDIGNDPSRCPPPYCCTTHIASIIFFSSPTNAHTIYTLKAINFTLKTLNTCPYMFVSLFKNNPQGARELQFAKYSALWLSQFSLLDTHIYLFYLSHRNEFT
jgi:hypothetical protein